MDIEKLIEQLKWWAEECDRTNKGCQARRILQDAATAFSTLQAENEKLCVELEQVREANKKLCAAMMSIKRTEKPERMKVVYEMDYAAALSHALVVDIAYMVFDGLMREDLRQRRPLEGEEDA